MLTADFDYDLPPELIAQHPAPDRTEARMMVVHREPQRIEHWHVADLPEYLRANGITLDLFFHDSLHSYLNTLGELVWFAPFYQPGCLLACHDAKMDWQPGLGVGRAIREFADTLKLPYVILDTTCGLAVARWRPDVDAQALRGLQQKVDALERQANNWRLLLLRKIKSQLVRLLTGARPIQNPA